VYCWHNHYLPDNNRFCPLNEEYSDLADRMIKKYFLSLHIAYNCIFPDQNPIDHSIGSAGLKKKLIGWTGLGPYNNA